MSIVTFWNNGKEQTGKTLSAVAIATYMAIEHNYKILVISTGFNDKSLDNCFWKEKKTKKNFGIFGPNKMVRSNKISPESITNYTKIIFKDRLEILQSYKGSQDRYDELKEHYIDVINLADKYYDLVFVDLDMELGEEIINNVLENSNLVVATLTQRLSSIDKFIEKREEMPILKSKKTLILIGRYDRYSKYTIKKNGLTRSYNLLPHNSHFGLLTK